ncbi:MAG: hypothetical protein NVSMB64_06450 [Candidatus Velthaea sp.]
MIGAINPLTSPGPGLLVGAALFILGALLFGIARFMPSSAPQSAGEGSAAAGIARLDLTGPVTHYERVMAWPRRIDPDAGVLDLDERRRIIEGLAVVGDAWCAEILAHAYVEEGEALREATIDAIGRCSGVVEPTLERALKSHRIVERYAAIDAASRRNSIALLERGLKDSDGTVALAAAYGLVRAHRPDLIDAGLAGRDDVRANEIRRILPVLT